MLNLVCARLMSANCLERCKRTVTVAARANIVSKHVTHGKTDANNRKDAILEPCKRVTIGLYSLKQTMTT